MIKSISYKMYHNSQFTGRMIDLETDQQDRNHPRPEPCVFYGPVANFPQHNINSVVPAPGNPCNFTFQPMLEHRDSALFYGMTQYNAVHHQHPVSNLDLAVSAPTGHYNPYTAPASGNRDFPLPVNHGANDQLSLSSTHGTVGIPSHNYRRIIPCMDGDMGSFKRKNAEGVLGNYHYHNASAGPSSSFGPPEYAGRDPTVIESGYHRSMRHPSMTGPESVLEHGASHMIRGNQTAPPVQFPGNPWLNINYRANTGDNGTLCWNQAPNPPYLHASVNGPCVEAGNIGIPGYQATATNRNSPSFLHAPIAQGHPNLHHPPPPMQGARRYNVNLPSQMATSSHRASTFSASNTGSNGFQDVLSAGPPFLAPVLPVGFQLYPPHQMEVILDPNPRHHNLPHLRILPEDGVAMLEISGYHEAGDFIDQHWDMRLDIDEMSYEELLALGEQIGSVGMGLTEEVIRKYLKTRTFASSAACSNFEESAHVDQKINFCVICQTDYEDQEAIGTLECGHECHGDCIMKWLVVKNICPICKSTALVTDRKDK